MAGIGAATSLWQGKSLPRSLGVCPIVITLVTVVQQLQVPLQGHPAMAIPVVIRARPEDYSLGITAGTIASPT